MSTHIIFDSNNKYVGYCDNDKWLKLFIKQRKGKYNIHDIDEKELHPNLKNELLEEWNKLTAITIADKVMVVTCAEGVEFLKQVDEKARIFRFNIDTILNMLPNIKFSILEKHVIEECLCILDSYIDIFEELGDDAEVIDKWKLFKNFIK